MGEVHIRVVRREKKGPPKTVMELRITRGKPELSRAEGGETNDAEGEK